MKSIVITVVALFSINAASNQMPDYTVLHQDGLELTDGASQEGKLSSAISLFKKALDKGKKYFPLVGKKMLEIYVGLEDAITPDNAEKIATVLADLGVIDAERIETVKSFAKVYQETLVYAQMLTGNERKEMLESAESTKKLLVNAALKALKDNEDKGNKLLNDVAGNE